MHARATLPPVSVAQGCHAARPGDTYARFRRPTVHYHTLGRHFCPISVAQRCRAARSGNTSAPFRRPMVPRRTPGRHLRPFPSPNGAAPHAQGTFLPLSVTQRGITTRSGDISAPFRRLTAPRRTPGRHLRPIPSPSGAAAHARGTLLPRSVAQRCRVARSGNTSATIRRPTGHYRTLGEHLSPFPSPNGAAAHARGTLLPRSVAQRCRVARSGNTSATIRRPTGHYRTLGEHLSPFPSPNGAAAHARATLTPVSVAGEGGARETDREVGVWGTDGRRGRV